MSGLVLPSNEATAEEVNRWLRESLRLVDGDANRLLREGIDGFALRLLSEATFGEMNLSLGSKLKLLSAIGGPAAATVAVTTATTTTATTATIKTTTTTAAATSSSSGGGGHQQQPNQSPHTKTWIYVLKLEQNKYYVGRTNTPSRRLEEHVASAGSAWTRMYKAIGIEMLTEVTSNFEEDKCVKELMAKHGIDNVRGGVYVQETLDARVREQLQRDIWGATDCCVQCGAKGHFVRDCPLKSTTAVLSAFGSQQQQQQQQQQQATAVSVSSTSTSSRVKKRASTLQQSPPKKKKTAHAAGITEEELRVFSGCTRCGRQSHQAAQCYAATAFDGLPLDDEESGGGGGDDDQDDSACFRCGREGHAVDECYAKTDVNGRWIK